MSRYCTYSIMLKTFRITDTNVLPKTLNIYPSLNKAKMLKNENRTAAYFEFTHSKNAFRSKTWFWKSLFQVLCFGI
jgi:hypothetical protein